VNEIKNQDFTASALLLPDAEREGKWKENVSAKIFMVATAKASEAGHQIGYTTNNNQVRCSNRKAGDFIDRNNKLKDIFDKYQLSGCRPHSPSGILVKVQ
jgi:hypothetical protein